MPPDEYTCEDCRNEFFSEDGQAYKYEPTTWLCVDCHDKRMEEASEGEDYPLQISQAFPAVEVPQSPLEFS